MPMLQQTTRTLARQPKSNPARRRMAPRNSASSEHADRMEVLSLEREGFTRYARYTTGYDNVIGETNYDESDFQFVLVLIQDSLHVAAFGVDDEGMVYELFDNRDDFPASIRAYREG